MARLSSVTARSNRAHSSCGPRLPVPGRSSYGGSAVSAPGIGRHRRPAAWACSHATCSSAAASARPRNRDANPASGGASLWARIASAHSLPAWRTARMIWARWRSRSSLKLIGPLLLSIRWAGRARWTRRFAPEEAPLRLPPVRRPRSPRRSGRSRSRWSPVRPCTPPRACARDLSA